MLKIKNCGPIEFKKKIQGKKIYVFGAGKALESCLEIYFENKAIEKIVDNNKELQGKVIKHCGTDIPIIDCEAFTKEISNTKNKSNAVLMISSPFYAAEIIEQLDDIIELDGLETFLQVLIRNTVEESSEFDFTKGKQKIPKKIHYIWVGGKPLPEEYEKNIETWKNNNPDYEIFRWDESNCDFSECDYVKEAYETKQWGFVSNYIRLDIIKRYGGIYLDTDVQVIKSLDCLLADDAFFNMGCADRVNNGCGFGAISNHPIIEDILLQYKNSKFITPDGRPGKRQGHLYLHNTLRRYGFEIVNQYQKRNGVVLYPMEVMSPQTMKGKEDVYTEKTVSVHQEAGTWKSEKEKEGMKKLLVLLNKHLEVKQY